MRIGLIGIDGSHPEDFLRHFNGERRYPGHRVVAAWGTDPARARELAAMYPDVATPTSPEALVAMVDAVIIGNRDGSLHAVHALPAIAARRPVFVDKPLANTLADATAMVDAAAGAGVPLLSGSALRWQPATQRLKARIAATDRPVRLNAWGTWFPDNAYGGTIYYAIHVVELAMELIGPGWEHVTVAAMDGGLVAGYRSPRGPVRLELRPAGAYGSTSFGVRIEALDGVLDEPIPLGDDYMAPVAERVVAMLEARRSPLTSDELLAPVALIAAIEKARS